MSDKKDSELVHVNSQKNAIKDDPADVANANDKIVTLTQQPEQDNKTADSEVLIAPKVAQWIDNRRPSPRKQSPKLTVLNSQQPNQQASSKDKTGMTLRKALEGNSLGQLTGDQQAAMRKSQVSISKTSRASFANNPLNVNNTNTNKEGMVKLSEQEKNPFGGMPSTLSDVARAEADPSKEEQNIVVKQAKPYVVSNTDKQLDLNSQENITNDPTPKNDNLIGQKQMQQLMPDLSAIAGENILSSIHSYPQLKNISSVLQIDKKSTTKMNQPNINFNNNIPAVGSSQPTGNNELLLTRQQHSNPYHKRQMSKDQLQQPSLVNLQERPSLANMLTPVASSLANLFSPKGGQQQSVGFGGGNTQIMGVGGVSRNARANQAQFLQSGLSLAKSRTNTVKVPQIRLQSDNTSQINGDPDFESNFSSKNLEKHSQKSTNLGLKGEIQEKMSLQMKEFENLLQSPENKRPQAQEAPSDNPNLLTTPQAKEEEDKEGSIISLDNSGGQAKTNLAHGKAGFKSNHKSLKIVVGSDEKQQNLRPQEPQNLRLQSPKIKKTFLDVQNQQTSSQKKAVESPQIVAATALVKDFSDHDSPQKLKGNNRIGQQLLGPQKNSPDFQEKPSPRTPPLQESPPQISNKIQMFAQNAQEKEELKLLNDDKNDMQKQEQTGQKAQVQSQEDYSKEDTEENVCFMNGEAFGQQPQENKSSPNAIVRLPTENDHHVQKDLHTEDNHLKNNEQETGKHNIKNRQNNTNDSEVYRQINQNNQTSSKNKKQQSMNYLQKRASQLNQQLEKIDKEDELDLRLKMAEKQQNFDQEEEKSFSLDLTPYGNDQPESPQKIPGTFGGYIEEHKLELIRKELDDSKIYFLSRLKREIEKEQDDFSAILKEQTGQEFIPKKHSTKKYTTSTKNNGSNNFQLQNYQYQHHHRYANQNAMVVSGDQQTTSNRFDDNQIKQTSTVSHTNFNHYNQNYGNGGMTTNTVNNQGMMLNDRVATGGFTPFTGGGGTTHQNALLNQGGFTGGNYSSFPCSPKKPFISSVLSITPKPAVADNGTHSGGLGKNFLQSNLVNQLRVTGLGGLGMNGQQTNFILPQIGYAAGHRRDEREIGDEQMTEQNGMAEGVGNQRRPSRIETQMQSTNIRNNECVFPSSTSPVRSIEAPDQAHMQKQAAVPDMGQEAGLADALNVDDIDVEYEEPPSQIVADRSDIFGVSQLNITEHQVVMEFTEKGRIENEKQAKGSWLQAQINKSKDGETIFLEPTTYKFHSLFISRAVQIIGQPGTVLEVDGGSIFVDFTIIRENAQANRRTLHDDNTTKNLLREVDVDSNNFATPNQRSEKFVAAIGSSEQISERKESIQVQPPAIERGTPLTIKKSSVAKIQICEVLFNRTKAALMLAAKSTAMQKTKSQPQQQVHHAVNNNLGGATSPDNLNHFSRDLSLGIAAASTSHFNPVQQQQFQSHLCCFVVENESFFEVRDCCIRSIKDKGSLDQELDNFMKNSNFVTPFNQNAAQKHLQNQIANNGATNNLLLTNTQNQQSRIEKTMPTQDVTSNRNDFLDYIQRQDNQIRDYCFSLNYPKGGLEELVSKKDPTCVTAVFSGLVSLCSTTIHGFMNGIYCGRDAILTCEQSSFVALRAGGCVIQGTHPKLVKFMNGSMQKCESTGIKIDLEDPLYAVIQSETSKDDKGQENGKEQEMTQNLAPNDHPNKSASNKKNYNNELPENNVLLQNKRDFGGERSPQSKKTINGQVSAQNVNMNTIPSQMSLGMTGHDGELQDGSLTTRNRKFIRKIYIENNRFVQVMGCPIHIYGSAAYQLEYLARIKDNRISNCGSESKLFAIPGATDSEKQHEEILIEQAYDRLGGRPESQILIENMRLHNLICLRNTISKGSGSGIKIFNVKGASEDMLADELLPKDSKEAESLFLRLVGDQERVTVIDNYIIDIVDGPGMIIDSSTCSLTKNQFKKNQAGGLLVTSTLRTYCTGTPLWSKNETFLTNKIQMRSNDNSEMDQVAFIGQNGPNFDNQNQINRDGAQKQKQSTKKLEFVDRIDQIRTFCQIVIDDDFALANQQYGMGFIGFYGFLVVKNCISNENEGPGMVFSQNLVVKQNVQINKDGVEVNIDYEGSNSNRNQRGPAGEDISPGTNYRNSPSGRQNGFETNTKRGAALSKNENLATQNGNEEEEVSQNYGESGEANCLIPLAQVNQGGRSVATTKNIAHISERPFQKLLSQACLYRCTVQQNRQDGLKSVDYTLINCGCTIQGNLNSAIRFYQNGFSEQSKIYLKSKANESDLIGRIVGPFGQRLQPRAEIKSNLTALVAEIKQAQLANAYEDLVEMAHEKEMQIQMTGGQEHDIANNGSSKMVGGSRGTIGRGSDSLNYRGGLRSNYNSSSRNNEQRNVGFFGKLFACCTCKTSATSKQQNLGQDRTILEKRPPVAQKHNKKT